MKKIFFITLAIIFAKNLQAQNVGIGTTTPLAKLSVLNTLGGYGITHTYGAVTMGTWISDTNGQFGTKSNHPLQFFTNNGNPQMTLIQNGNVGIGTATPEAKLAITQTGLQSALYIYMPANINSGYGIQINNRGTGSGIISQTANGNAVWGIAESVSAAGVIGDNTLGEAVVGRNRGGNGIGAVVGRNDSSGYGVRGFNTKTGIGVLGEAGISGGTGIAGLFQNYNVANSSNVLVAMNHAAGNAIYGEQNNLNNAAIRGTCIAANGNGVIGEANIGTGSYALWGYAGGGGQAGHFSGNVQILGTLSKSAGTFKIDHPQDPENKFLIHSFVESPDMMNIYNGEIKTDASGTAIVNLPSYFEAENITFRYQLTIIDETQFAQARIAKRISNNQFSIVTDKPNISISWMVTGIRNDPYARQHRIIDVVEKNENEKGKYLNPLENGQPISKGMDYEKMTQCGIGSKAEARQTNTPEGLVSSMPCKADTKNFKAKNSDQDKVVAPAQVKTN
jgi:hypothetical protein